MTDHDFKSLLAADIKTIRMLSPEVIPAKPYYLTLAKAVGNGFWKVWLIIALTLIYPSLHYPDKYFTTQWVIEGSFILGFFISLPALLILCSPISSFILFRFHLKSRLKTGELLERKFKQVATAFIGFFALFCALFASYAYPEQILIMVVFSYFLSLGATCFVVNLELKRIGLSTMYRVIHEFFNKANRC